MSKPIPGDDRKAHGFDLSKKNPTSLFYLPCQPNDPSGKYFKTFKGKGRKPLVPSEWDMGLDQEPENFKAFSFEQGPDIREDWVEGARGIWRETGCSPGKGNAGFFKLGVSLRWAGCDEATIRQILMEEAPFANTPRDRVNQIPSIINTLRSRQYGDYIQNSGKALEKHVQ